ncbi:MAG: PIN domain-containing protein [archaeon]
MSAKYFYDTYALTEYAGANKNYAKYFGENTGVTTRLNLMELYYAILRDNGKEKADLAYDSFFPITIEPNDGIIKKAMALRLRLKQEKKNVSYVDAIGYQLSIVLKMKFLTGDAQFRGAENVEFVK